MIIETDENGDFVLREVYNPVVFKKNGTDNKPVALAVSMRGDGFDLILTFNGTQRFYEVNPIDPYGISRNVYR